MPHFAATTRCEFSSPQEESNDAFEFALSALKTALLKLAQEKLDKMPTPCNVNAGIEALSQRSMEAILTKLESDQEAMITKGLKARRDDLDSKRRQFREALENQHPELLAAAQKKYVSAMTSDWPAVDQLISLRVQIDLSRRPLRTAALDAVKELPALRQHVAELSRMIEKTEIRRAALRDARNSRADTVFAETMAKVWKKGEDLYSEFRDALELDPKHRDLTEDLRTVDTFIDAYKEDHEIYSLNAGEQLADKPLEVLSRLLDHGRTKRSRDLTNADKAIRRMVQDKRWSAKLKELDALDELRSQVKEAEDSHQQLQDDLLRKADSVRKAASRIRSLRRLFTRGTDVPGAVAFYVGMDEDKRCNVDSVQLFEGTPIHRNAGLAVVAVQSGRASAESREMSRALSSVLTDATATTSSVLRCTDVSGKR